MDYIMAKGKLSLSMKGEEPKISEHGELLIKEGRHPLLDPKKVVPITAGIGGAFCATLGVVLPSFLVILIVAKFYERFRSSRIVEGAMTGLRPAVIGLIAASLLSIGTTVFTPAVSTRWLPVAISGCLFILMSILSFKKKHPILIIALSAVIGIITGYTLGL
jgi:chromate transporter